ncbi:hypothetical protein [Flexivirga sp. B27]
MGRSTGVRTVIAVAAGATLLSGCGASGGADEKPPTTKDHALATALSYVPDNLMSMQFGDTTAWLEDHGFADESPTELVKDDAFWRKSQNASFAESPLWQYARAMGGWGWSATDIAWSATANRSGDKTVIHYVRFRDSTDVGMVRKSLVAHGYRAKGSHLVAPTLGHTQDEVTEGVTNAIGQTVRFYPDKHLMVSTWYGHDVPDLPDEDSSLGARPEVRRAVAPISTASEVTVNTGTDACRTPPKTTPMMKQRLNGLGKVSTSVAAVVSDSKSIAAVEYSSEEAAKDDLPRRKALLEKNSLRMNEPYQSLAHFAVTRKGTALRYTITGRSRIVPEMLRSGDSPWDLCSPHSKST